MGTFSKFTNLYKISKTLRFELRPIGKTLEHIVASGLLEQDKTRSENYVQVKKIIDNYHRYFIERVLADFRLKVKDEGKEDSLEEYYTFYMCHAKEESQRKIFEKIQASLRKQIAGSFSKDKAYKRIDKKELIKEDLSSIFNNEEDKLVIEEFKDFTTYFTGFHKNRKNMYSAEDKSTAISYRLIHENLPRFIDNISTFNKVAISDVAEKFDDIYRALEADLNVAEIKEMFQLDYFNEVLTQKRINVYNKVIGGFTLDDGTKIQGLNEYINLYNQQQKDKHSRLPKFKPLYKQILSDRDAISWLLEQFESDNNLLEAVEKVYKDFYTHVLVPVEQGNVSLKELLQRISDYDVDKIYIRNDQQLTAISQKLYKDWNVITKALIGELKNSIPKKKKETIEDYEERLHKFFKSQKSISIGQINYCLAQLNGEEPLKPVQDYFSVIGLIGANGVDLFTQIENAYSAVKDLLNTDYPSDRNLAQDNNAVEKIKFLLDAIKTLQEFVKPLLGDGNEPDKDGKFYGEFISLWEELNKITPLYNMVRNYITRKPYSVDKIKLNFENSTLMDGWDLNKEHDNTSVILRRNGMYYLAIMNKKHNRVFDIEKMPTEGECYEKMEYKLLPGANKMFPKVFIRSESGRDEFKPSEELLENYEKKTHVKGENFSLRDCHALIDFFKSSIEKHEDWRQFDFDFSDTETYEDISGFYREADHQGYKISFRNVSVEYIDNLVDNGFVYLFNIYNKDFSPYSKGTPNLHTLYWTMLFDERNLSDVVYKLNGQAEVFFRKSSISYDKPTHPANQYINNKNGGNPKKQSLFAYDLVKDKRYTVDKFLFHVPITINFKSRDVANINTYVNEHIQQSDDLHIIGIDRGERHLLYLTVIDLKGNIKEQYSLNEIVNEYKDKETTYSFPTNYHSLLDEREKERMKARYSWKTIESIKELKEGYLSQVIHRIALLMIKYNAIVVLEDLNMGFMRGRHKVEKQVYQKFEKMLIDKLNYMVDKQKTTNEIGGILNAYQLTNKFVSFEKMGKQNGFLFYIPAWSTSKIDPVTGFVNLFDTRYETIVKSKEFFNKFETIRYNAGKDWFEFLFDYADFTHKADGTRTKWTLCTWGDRIKTFRNVENNSEWTDQDVNLTDEFKTFFKKYNIDIHGNLKVSIVAQDSKDFFEELLRLFKLTLQMRNSKTNSDVDYILSPVCTEDGEFYDSRKMVATLPLNADANGAYNIARKGLWIVRRIKQSKDLNKLKLNITSKEWLEFAQTKPYLND